VDGESLDSWATSNNLGLFYNPKETASFFSHRWNVGTRPGLCKFRPGQSTAEQTSPRKVPAVTTSAFPYNATEAQGSCPQRSGCVGTFARLIGSAFAFSEMIPLRDCRLRTQQILRGHSKIFVRAYFLRPNNVSHVGARRTMCHAGTKSARPSNAPSPEPRWGLTLIEPLRPYYLGSGRRNRSDGRKQ